MAAVLFMACENKGGAAGGSAATVINETSNKVIAALGSADAVTVDADLLKLGFKRAEESEADDAPVRKLAPRKFTKDAEDYVTYTYNLPANYTSVEDPAFYQELANTKKLVVILYVVYMNDKLYAVEGGAFISQYAANYNAVYTDFSNNLYASIPAQADINWIAEAYSMTAEKRFTDHAELIRNFASYMSVMEECAFVKDNKSVEYELMWNKSLDSAEARQEGILPFCMGAFSIGLGN